MIAFVALLRGINVGFARKLPMADLRALCLKRGLHRPETYIQSGNLIVDAEIDADERRILLEREIKARFAFNVDVVVRAAKAWQKYIDANPFAGEDDVR